MPCCCSICSILGLVVVVAVVVVIVVEHTCTFEADSCNMSVAVVGLALHIVAEHTSDTVVVVAAAAVVVVEVDSLKRN